MLHWLWGEGQHRGLHPDPGTAPHSCRATAASWCQFRLAPWCPEPARAQEPASGWWGKEVERWQLGVPPALAVCQMSSKPTSAVPSRGIRGLGCPALGCRWVTGGLSCLHALPLAKRCHRDSSTWLPHCTKPIFCSCPPLGGCPRKHGGLWLGLARPHADGKADGGRPSGRPPGAAQTKPIAGVWLGTGDKTRAEKQCGGKLMSSLLR